MKQLLVLCCGLLALAGGTPGPLLDRALERVLDEFHNKSHIQSAFKQQAVAESVVETVSFPPWRRGGGVISKAPLMEVALEEEAGLPTCPATCGTSCPEAYLGQGRSGVVVKSVATGIREARVRMPTCARGVHWVTVGQAPSLSLGHLAGLLWDKTEERRRKAVGQQSSR